MLGLGARRSRLVDGAIAVTARGLTRGAIASVLQPAHLLREGNALLNIGFAVAVVGGSALAGLLIAEVGLAVALLADAASFLAIAVVLALARDLPARRREPEGTLERLRGGLAFARRNARVRLLLGGQSVALILFTLIIPIEVIYAKESLGTTSAGFGILLASWGAGIVAGSIVYVGVRDRSAAAPHPALDCRHRCRLPRHGGRAEPADRLPALRARRHRQRDPVGLGDDGAPGGDARRATRHASSVCSSPRSRRCRASAT